MELGSPLQYETFLALQGSGRHHGIVDYTNWTYAEPGSGVYAPQSGAHQLTFVYQGAPYAHTLNGGLKLVALSPDRLAFSGTGLLQRRRDHLDDHRPGYRRPAEGGHRLRRPDLQGDLGRQGCR